MDNFSEIFTAQCLDCKTFDKQKTIYGRCGSAVKTLCPGLDMSNKEKNRLMKNLRNRSRLLSMILRHKPDTIKLTLDKSGWANVYDLLGKIGWEYRMLVAIVESNDKKRFEFSEDLSLIRACQGHSIDVDLKLEPLTPPDYLYHGTDKKNIHMIKENGILKMSRQHVHLSSTINTAINVGKRHGNDTMVILISTKCMTDDGIKFYKSTNGVWLTDHIDPKYITKIWSNNKNKFVDINGYRLKYILDFCDHCSELKINFDGRNNNCDIYIDVPHEIEEYVTMELINQIMSEYIPDMSNFIGQNMNEQLKQIILNSIKEKEHEIMCAGGRSFKDELKYKLGVLMSENDNIIKLNYNIGFDIMDE